MKKYTPEQLEEAINAISNADLHGTVMSDFLTKLKGELKKRTNVFVKATDAYMSKLYYDDCYTRPLKEDEYGYYPGMYGCFEKKTDKLLRRHTDTGFLRGGLKHRENERTN
jgi:hypothetical protein